MNENKEIGLEFTICKAIDWVMGSALDMARMSEMSDRAFKQFERSMKDNASRIKYTILEDLKKDGHLQTHSMRLLKQDKYVMAGETQ